MIVVVNRRAETWRNIQIIEVVHTRMDTNLLPMQKIHYVQEGKKREERVLPARGRI